VDGPPRLDADVAVAGVDGCRSGWVVAIAAAGAAPTVRPDRPVAVEVEVVASFDAVAALLREGRVGLVAVDMPIGLSERDPRPCDRAARALAGPRRASVFPAPLRATVGASDYGEALARSRAVSGRGLSVQAFNLLAKITEVERAVRELGQARIVEAFPELGFAGLSGAAMAHPKRNAAGASERLAALEPWFAAVRDLARSRRGAAADDVLDALAVLWIARRIAAGAAARLGGERDATGLRMEVWY